MSVRTKSMTHFISAASGYAAIEKQAGELAKTVYEGLRELANECTVMENLLTAFDKAMIEAEAEVKADLPEGVTLSSYSGSWRKVKSQLRKGVKAGVDPTKHATKGAFLKATDEITGGNSLGKPKPTKAPADNGSGKGKAGNPTASVAEVTTGNKLSAKARERLNNMLKVLEQLPEEEQLTVLSNCHGAIAKKLSKLGRFKAASKTA